MSAPHLFEGADIAGARLLKRLAETPELEVWKATAEGRDIAVVGVVRTHDATAVGRFYASATTMHQLTQAGACPGLLQVSAVSPDGLAYAASNVWNMGSVENVGALAWDLERRLALLTQIAQTVASLHAAGYAHGALLAENVMLDDDLRPVVTDVGRQDPAELAQSLTTMASVAPEHATGAPASIAGDVFALGKLLHVVLFDVQPTFESEDPPRLRPLADVAPPGLTRIARKCLRPAPESRYATVTELLADLARWRDTAAVGVGHPEVAETEPLAVEPPPPSGGHRPGAPVPAPTPSNRGQRIPGAEPSKPKSAATSKEKGQGQPKGPLIPERLRLPVLAGVLVVSLATAGVVFGQRDKKEAFFQLDFEPNPYAFLFGATGTGGAKASVTADPKDSGNQVAKIEKVAGATPNAGAILSLDQAPATKIMPLPVGGTHTRGTLRLLAPESPVTVRVRVEASSASTTAIEIEAVAKGPAGTWQTVELDFSKPAPGTSPLAGLQPLDTLTVMPAFGAPGAEGKVYYVDDFVFE